MDVTKETFFVICSESGYWHYNATGALVDCWGDPLTAERFDTREEAQDFIDMECGAHDLDGDDCPKVARVTTNIAVRVFAPRRRKRRSK